MNPTEPRGRRVLPGWVLGAGLAGLVVGLLLPWIEISLVTGGEGYVPFDLPLLAWAVWLWTGGIVVSVLLARFSNSPALAVVAAVVTTTSAVAAAIATVVMWRVPEWVPTGLLPSDARPFAPSLRSGPGPLCTTIGCVLLAVWVLRQASVRVQVQRAMGGSWITGEARSTGPDALDWPGTAPAGAADSDDDIWGPSPW